jgi:hypothetical protein
LKNEKDSFCLRLPSCGFYGGVMRFNRQDIRFNKPERAFGKQQHP